MNKTFTLNSVRVSRDKIMNTYGVRYVDWYKYDDEVFVNYETVDVTKVRDFFVYAYKPNVSGVSTVIRVTALDEDDAIVRAHAKLRGNSNDWFIQAVVEVK